ncbi:MAG: gamma-glutamyl-gamma-aminobutyrate hydrolase family protein, partial [Firmicutes bacterium]|nr:gamma-glutamyl-gamma-aminobutyrate hydrolase family protein [Bacillota bacterium]
MTEKIVILDFGAQYSQLIARRVRECHVYSEIVPFDVSLEELRAMQASGIILSGGPSSVYGQGAPVSDPGIFGLGVPVLGICYGMQLMAHQLGGEVFPARKREYGRTGLTVSDYGDLFTGLDSREPGQAGSRGPGEVDLGEPGEANSGEPGATGSRDLGEALVCWMSHGDTVQSPPPGFEVMAATSSTPVAAMADRRRKLYGVQFHPEVVHTPRGKEIICNFVLKICGCSGSWNMGSFADQAVAEIRRRVGDGHMVCGLSGGVDSSVAATLAHRAVGDRLTCIFVDHGFLRKGEAEQV